MHTEILSKKQVTVLERVKEVWAIRSFYLASGTALALRHGHRRSIDFDFFTRRSFDARALLRSIERVFPRLERIQADEDTLYVRLLGVTTSFFRLRYPLLRAKQRTAWGFGLASDDDIAAMKIEAIAGRGSRKDFIDLRVLCACGLRVERALLLFQRKYGARRTDTYHRLRALAYFDDAEREPMPEMLVPFDWNETREFFTAEATRLLAKALER